MRDCLKKPVWKFSAREPRGVFAGLYIPNAYTCKLNQSEKTYKKSWSFCLVLPHLSMDSPGLFSRGFGIESPGNIPREEEIGVAS